MVTQTSPGTIQLANELMKGAAAESIAFNAMEKAMGNYNTGMVTAAQEQQVTGQKMQDVTATLTLLQTIAGGVMFGVTLLGGLAIGFGYAGAITSTTSAGFSAGLNGATQATQGILGAVQGGVQLHKSDLTAKTENSSTTVSTLQKFSENNASTIQAESQGTQKIGSSVNTMLTNEGAVEKQKIN